MIKQNTYISIMARIVNNHLVNILNWGLLAIDRTIMLEVLLF